MGELLDLATSALVGAQGGEAVEAYAVHGVATSVAVYGGEVETLTSAETRGVGVRVVVDRRLGFASSSDVTPPGLERALAQARSNAAFGTPDVGNVLPEPAPWEPMPAILVPGLESVPAARKVELALELERATLAADPRVRAVQRATYGDGISRAAVASTTGVSAEYARSDVYAYVSALARAGEETQTGFGLTTGRSVAELDIAAAAAEGAARAARLLGARKPANSDRPFCTASALNIDASTPRNCAVTSGSNTTGTVVVAGLRAPSSRAARAAPSAAAAAMSNSATERPVVSPNPVCVSSPARASAATSMPMSLRW